MTQLFAPAYYTTTKLIAKPLRKTEHKWRVSKKATFARQHLPALNKQLNKHARVVRMRLTNSTNQPQVNTCNKLQQERNSIHHRPKQLKNFQIT